MKILLLAAFIAAFSLPAQAQMIQLPTTPDLAVTASATADFSLKPRQFTDWIYIKNDCAKDLWFDFRGAREGVGRDYPLKLSQNQTFQAFIKLNSLGVSPDNTGTACTFTFIPARK